jgi:hypothetical protein
MTGKSKMQSRGGGGVKAKGGQLARCGRDVGPGRRGAENHRTPRGERAVSSWRDPVGDSEVPG